MLDECAVKALDVPTRLAFQCSFITGLPMEAACPPCLLGIITVYVMSKCRASRASLKRKKQYLSWRQYEQLGAVTGRPYSLLHHSAATG